MTARVALQTVFKKVTEFRTDFRERKTINEVGDPEESVMLRSDMRNLLYASL